MYEEKIVYLEVVRYLYKKITTNLCELIWLGIVFKKENSKTYLS